MNNTSKESFDRWDKEWKDEQDVIIADYEAELKEEAEEEALREATILEAVRIDLLDDYLDMKDQFDHQRRIHDEITDRKEEDGGEYRPILFP